MSWHRIASVHDLARGDRRVVTVEGKELALIHNSRGVWCIDFRCPHTGGPLGEGLFDETSITCPLHKWRFRLDDGSHNRKGDPCPPAAVYQLKVEGEDLLVQV